nr:rrna methyltransferase 1, mitochondrial [Quercus suber]
MVRPALNARAATVLRDWGPTAGDAVVLMRREICGRSAARYARRAITLKQTLFQVRCIETLSVSRNIQSVVNQLSMRTRNLTTIRIFSGRGLLLWLDIYVLDIYSGCNLTVENSMSNALRPAYRKLNHTFVELYTLPLFQAQYQTRAKSIASAIKDGLVREGNPRDRRQDVAAREARSGRLDTLSSASGKRRVARQESPSFGRDSIFASKTKSSDEPTRERRATFTDSRSSRYESSFGRRGGSYEGTKRVERPTDSRNKVRSLRRDDKTFIEGGSTFARPTRGTDFSKRHASSTEQRLRLPEGRERQRDSGGNSSGGGLGFHSKSGMSLEQSRQPITHLGSVASKTSVHESGQPDFSGKAWELPANLNDVRILMNNSATFTAAQYRAGVEVLEDMIRERLQNGQTRNASQNVEAMLRDFDQKWSNTGSEASDAVNESVRKQKRELEYAMQKLLARLPYDDADRERWSRWILTAQLKRHDIPLRISSHGVKMDATVQTANETKGELVAVMKQLVEELPETDKDRRNYAAHLKHHFRLCALGAKPSTAETRDRDSMGNVAASVSEDQSTIVTGTTAHKLASQDSTENNDNTDRLSRSNSDRAATRQAITQELHKQNDKQSDISQQHQVGSGSLARRANTRTESSSIIDAGSGKDDTPLSISYSTAASTFLYGTNVVLAALRAKRRKMYRLYTTERNNRNLRRATDRYGVSDGGIGRIISLAKNADLAIEFDTSVRVLDKMSESRPHNGVVLEASYIPSPPVLSMGPPDAKTIPLVLNHQSVEEADVNGSPSAIPRVSSQTEGKQPMVVLLDGIIDPGNLGNILRSAHFYGVDAVAIATNTCASLNLATLAKASSGACEAVSILSLPKPANFVADAGRAGWKVYAAVAPPSGLIGDRTPPSIRRLTTSNLGNPLERKPVLLMLGAEGEGLRANLANKADYWLSIEQRESQHKDRVIIHY